MKKPDLYHKTVSILYDAYFNDTLEHGNCYACAVGNLIAANNGIQFTKHHPAAWYMDGNREEVTLGWNGKFCYAYGTRDEAEDWLLCIRERGVTDKAIEQIASTGYSIKEAARIENAFESADKGNGKEDYMFNGLVAVLNVLAEIHEVGEDVQEVEKTRFVKHYKNNISPKPIIHHL